MEAYVFQNISPLDHRYRVSDPALADQLRQYLSEDAFVRYQLQVEVALTETLAARGLCSPAVAEAVRQAAAAVTPAEVYQREQQTRHNVRALVNAIRDRLPEEARPYVHFTATSMDILDTARALQYRAVTREVLLPRLGRLLRTWIALARREADTVQIGRTHGQHAVPITFGFAVAEYVARLGERMERLSQAAANLRGKMAGAVGAYNASALFFPDPEAFEREVLARLGLEPGEHATQVVAPEYITDYVHALVSCLGVLANFADDLRHLQRTEIGETGEAFDPQQVGSSTMPHKRNPWNFEHVKSLWKTFMPRMMTVYMDQISEHQRDLTNSASSRFIVEVAAGLALAASRLARESERLAVDREAMARNLALTRGLIAAEPLYILLASLGHPDAHEAVRRLTLEAEAAGRPLAAAAQDHPELAPYLARLTPEQRRVLEQPERYTGIAARRARAICDRWEQRLPQLLPPDAGTEHQG
ncbi:MAG TPA: lyase family protein [Limnochordales bacterium]|nr:lyase family protein [Limnochordales bacterium]